MRRKHHCSGHNRASEGPTTGFIHAGDPIQTARTVFVLKLQKVHAPVVGDFAGDENGKIFAPLRGGSRGTNFTNFRGSIL